MDTNKSGSSEVKLTLQQAPISELYVMLPTSIPLFLASFRMANAASIFWAWPAASIIVLRNIYHQKLHKVDVEKSFSITSRTFMMLHAENHCFIINIESTPVWGKRPMKKNSLINLHVTTRWTWWNNQHNATNNIITEHYTSSYVT